MAIAGVKKPGSSKRKEPEKSQDVKESETQGPAKRSRRNLKPEASEKGLVLSSHFLVFRSL